MFTCLAKTSEVWLTLRLRKSESTFLIGYFTCYRPDTSTSRLLLTTKMLLKAIAPAASIGLKAGCGRDQDPL
jgi:hypothetical protein